MTQRFAIVGMPRSGKSSLGHCMAKKLNVPFYDLDALIVEHVQCDLKTFISKAGEDAFRKAEHEQLIHFLNNAPQSYVLACGGGTPCFYDNITEINKHCRTIFLDTDLSVIEQRISEDPHAMFALEDPKDTRQWIEALYQKRSPFYRQSALIVGPEAIQSPYLFTKHLYLFTKTHQL